MPNINLVAVLLAAVAAMVVGFVWYSKALFASQWMKLSGVSAEKMAASKDKMPVTYGTMFLAALVTAYVLGIFINYTGARTLVDGAVIGFWAWLGFVATSFLSGVLFEGRPLKLYYINAGYQLVNLMVMGAVLVKFS